MDSNTYGDEKEVRQQCDRLEEVDAALALADDTGLVSKSRQSYFEASITLAAEVRRLREAKHVMSENEGRLHARIANLETKLARVEALPAKWRKDAEIYSACGGDADELEAALRDEQPITPPSKAEVDRLLEMNAAMEKHGSWIDKELRKIVVSLSRDRELGDDVKQVLGIIQTELSKLLVLDTEPQREPKLPYNGY